MSADVPTPSDVTITPRDLAFGREAANPRSWLGGDPVATAVYDSLSATFPFGERFFMETVRRYRDRVPPHLQAQIAAFVAQEALHSREHVAFNRQVAEHGYDVSRMEQRTKERLDIARGRHPIGQLAATMALEHFTAILAHQLLKDSRHLAGAPEEARRMWRWHAMEEVEHKAVAFDTFLAVTAHIGRFRRWKLRNRVMVLSTFFFLRSIKRNIADHFAQDGLKGVRPWLRLLRFLLVEPGIARRALPAYLAYYRPGFHPWAHDDRALLRQAEAEFATAPA